MDYFYIFLLRLYCVGVAFFLYYILHRLDGEAIAEIGYRSTAVKKKIRKRQKNQPKWDYFLYWSISKNAVINKRVVWVYFALNILVCLFGVVSLVQFLVPVSMDTWRSTIRNQLHFFLGAFIAHTFLRFVMDLFFLPSEQRRYNLRNK